MKYVLIDAECSEVYAIYAMTPELAAEAVDVANGDKDGWRYVKGSRQLGGPGYEIFDGAQYAGEPASEIRAKFSWVANVAKVMDRPNPQLT